MKVYSLVLAIGLAGCALLTPSPLPGPQVKKQEQVVVTPVPLSSQPEANTLQAENKGTCVAVSGNGENIVWSCTPTPPLPQSHKP